MSAFSDLILFVVNLAVNLFLFGLFIAGGLAVSFGLIKNAAPRLRYTIVVAAFLIAAIFPLVVSYNGSIGLEAIFEARQTRGADAFSDNLENQNSFAKLELNLPAPKSEAEKPSFGSLNNFTSFVADSFIGTVIFILWVLVSAALLTRDVIAHRQLKKARQTWRRATNAERAELALPGEIPLYFGEESPPATIGLLRPVILLPECFPADLSLAAKRFIVRHEAAHAQWRDPLVNCFLRLICALFWVSPALWMLERIAAAERESAADHAAISNVPANGSEFEATVLDYAETLVSVAKHFNSLTRRTSFKAGIIGLSSGSVLENRIRRLLAYSSGGTARLRSFLALIIFAGTLTGMLFMPIAFQAGQTDDRDKAAIINGQNSENLPDTDDIKKLPMPSRQNKVPPVAEFNKNKEEGNTNASALKQNESQPKEFSNEARENVEIPQVVFQLSKPAGTINKNSGGGREDLMRKLSEEDAKNSELRREVNELSDKLQTLDDAKKNLENEIFRMRQKADADAKMMQMRTVVNTN